MKSPFGKFLPRRPGSGSYRNPRFSGTPSEKATCRHIWQANWDSETAIDAE